MMNVFVSQPSSENIANQSAYEKPALYRLSAKHVTPHLVGLGERKIRLPLSDNYMRDDRTPRELVTSGLFIASVQSTGPAEDN